MKSANLLKILRVAGMTFWGAAIALWPYTVYVPLLKIRSFLLPLFGAYLLSAVIVFQSGCWKEIRMPRLILLFLGLNILSFLLFSSAYSIHSHPDITKILGASLFFPAALILFRTISDYIQVMKGILLVTAILVGALIIKHAFFYHSFHLTQFFTEAGFRENAHSRHQLSFFLSLMFPFYFAWFSIRRDWLSFSGFVLILFAILYTLSRSAILVTLFSMFLFCVISARRRWFVAVSSFILIGFVLVSVSMKFDPKQFMELRGRSIAQIESTRIERPFIDLSASRMRYFRQAVQGALEKPLVGHGIGSFSRNHPEYWPDGSLKRWPPTHNDFVQVLYELGFGGLFLFATLFGALLWKMVKIKSLFPVRYLWVFEAQIVAVLTLLFALCFINAYQTIPFWFILAGGYLFLSRMTVQTDVVSSGWF